MFSFRSLITVITHVGVPSYIESKKLLLLRKLVFFKIIDLAILEECEEFRLYSFNLIFSSYFDPPPNSVINEFTLGFSVFFFSEALSNILRDVPIVQLKSCGR
jgi:hypothetical protein